MDEAQTFQFLEASSTTWTLWDIYMYKMYKTMSRVRTEYTPSKQHTEQEWQLDFLMGLKTAFHGQRVRCTCVGEGMKLG